MERDTREDQKELQHRRVPPKVLSYCPRGGSSGCSGTLLRGGKDGREKVRPESERSPRSSSSACCGHSPVADYHSQDASRGMWAGLPPNSEFHWLPRSKGDDREKEPGCFLRVVPGTLERRTTTPRMLHAARGRGFRQRQIPLAHTLQWTKEPGCACQLSKEGGPALLLSLGNSSPTRDAKGYGAKKAPPKSRLRLLSLPIEPQIPKSGAYFLNRVPITKRSVLAPPLSSS